MYDFSKKYEKENFDKFLVDFLPEDIVFINKDLKLNESYKFFEKCKINGTVKDSQNNEIPAVYTVTMILWSNNEHLIVEFFLIVVLFL